EPEREVGDEPLVGLEEAKLVRLAPGLLANDARDGRPVARDLVGARSARLAGFGERLEVRLHGLDLRHGLADGTLDLLRDLVRLLEREIAGQLEMQRELRPRVERDDAD